ncbi:hypothetical protein Tco_1382358 [Tanacetum coccineum]
MSKSVSSRNSVVALTESSSPITTIDHRSPLIITIHHRSVNSIDLKEEDVDLDLFTCMASESDSSQPLPEVSDVKTPTSTATEQINSYAVDSSSQPTTKVTDVKPHT